MCAHPWICRRSARAREPIRSVPCVGCTRRLSVSILPSEYSMCRGSSMYKRKGKRRGGGRREIGLHTLRPHYRFARSHHPRLAPSCKHSPQAVKRRGNRPAGSAVNEASSYDHARREFFVLRHDCWRCLRAASFGFQRHRRTGFYSTTSSPSLSLSCALSLSLLQ